MNLFVCVLALSLVSATICVPLNNSHVVTKRGASYGGYASAPIIESQPTTFMEQVVVPPPIPVIETPVAPVLAPVAPVSYSQQSSMLTRDDVVNGVFSNEIHELEPEYQKLCLNKNNNAESIFYLQHPTQQSWYIQCDEQGKGYLKKCPEGTIFTENLVCESITNLHAVEKKTVIKPQLESVVGSYNTAPIFGTDLPISTVENTKVEIVHEAPEFAELCVSKKSYGLGSSIRSFYVQHPTQPSWYIQCDETGRAFLKECPTGTIFTLNKVCEKIGELHAVESEQTVIAPREQLDRVNIPTSYSSGMTVSSYGSSASTGSSYGSSTGSLASSPVVSMDTTSFVADNAKEAPEFHELCLSKRTAGVAVFYLQHPNKQSWYIQCDESGRAFVKECPAGTIFTLNLACENVNDLHAIEKTVVAPQLDSTVGSYNVAPTFKTENAASTILRTTVITESPEFNELCLSKRTAGVAVFYLPHPNKQSWYIQCDETGRAFVKECPAGTIFTSILTCEKIGELHSSFEENVVVPVSPVQYEQSIVAVPSISTVSYGASAPSLGLEESASPVVEQARVEVIQESTEFKSMCQSNSQFGITTFYLPHPTKQSWYIQCDEFGHAFLKECPQGTIFTSRLSCEKIGELHEVVETVVVRPAEREQSIQQPILSYGEQRHVDTTPIVQSIPIQQPILSSSYGQQTRMESVAPIVVAPKATTILREQSNSYSSASRPVLQTRRVVQQQVLTTRPVLREHQSYGTRQVLREQPSYAMGY